MARRGTSAPPARGVEGRGERCRPGSRGPARGSIRRRRVVPAKPVRLVGCPGPAATVPPAHAEARPGPWPNRRGAGIGSGQRNGRPPQCIDARAESSVPPVSAVGGAARRRALRVVAGTLAAAALAVTPRTAAADLRDPDEARRAGRTIESALLTHSGWTGDSQSCHVGTESRESLVATRRVINAMRRAAGLPKISLSPDLDARARTAALMMLAKGQLSHIPGPDWPCRSEIGRAAAARSNLFGAWGAVRSGGDAILGYLADQDFDSLGHRRVVLSPRITTFGSGSTEDLTTRESTNALLIGEVGPAPRGTRVAWPPTGYVLSYWLPDRWSLSLGGEGETVDASAPHVTMTLDGQPVAVSDVSALGSGWDTSEAIAWTPQIDLAALVTDWVEGRKAWDEARHVRVRITGVTVDGVMQQISYSVRVIYAPTPPSLPLATPPGAARASVRLAAVSDGSKLRIDVDPDRGPGYWRVQVEERSTGTWRTLPSTYRTQGSRETRTIDMGAGTYRVVVLPRYGLAGTTSDAVTLSR